MYGVSACFVSKLWLVASALCTCVCVNTVCVCRSHCHEAVTEARWQGLCLQELHILWLHNPSLVSLTRLTHYIMIIYWYALYNQHTLWLSIDISYTINIHYDYLLIYYHQHTLWLSIDIHYTINIHYKSEFPVNKPPLLPKNRAKHYNNSDNVGWW